MGEVPKGFVELEEGARLSPAEIQSHLSGRLADYKIPREVDVLDELPRNALGKVLKRVLRGEQGKVSA